MEEERERQIAESKNTDSLLNAERSKTYDRLVMVQEDLLHHVRGMMVGAERGRGRKESVCVSPQADAAMKEEQQRRIVEDKKQAVHEQLVQAVSMLANTHHPCLHTSGEKFTLSFLSGQVGKKQAIADQDRERQRRVSESISEEDAKRRIDIALKMVDVQKELLAAHPPIKVCGVWDGPLFVLLGI